MSRKPRASSTISAFVRRLSILQAPTHTDTHTDTQTNRQADERTDRQRDRQIDRLIIERLINMYRWTDGHKNREKR